MIVTTAAEQMVLLGLSTEVPKNIILMVTHPSADHAPCTLTAHSTQTTLSPHTTITSRTHGA